jgi:uncharacterized oxidoreductase
MRMTNNTILITGGGSGIGRALAEAFHKRDNQVIISGRRKERLQATVDANPGIVRSSMCSSVCDRLPFAAVAPEQGAPTCVVAFGDVFGLSAATSKIGL